MAIRLSARAEGRAQVHHALRVRAQAAFKRDFEALGISRCEQGFMRFCPKDFIRRRTRCGAYAVNAAQYSFDIAIEDGRGMSVGEYGNGRRGGCADAG